MSEIAYPAPAANTKIRKKLKVLLPMFMQHIKINSNFKGTHNKLKTVAGFVIF
jgi:hypothetical protein